MSECNETWRELLKCTGDEAAQKERSMAERVERTADSWHCGKDFRVFMNWYVHCT